MSAREEQPPGARAARLHLTNGGRNRRFPSLLELSQVGPQRLSRRR
jgi:hypothetical protein